MRVKVFMMSAGLNSERDVLRKMHDGIYNDLIPSSRKELRYIRGLNKSKGRGTGVNDDHAAVVALRVATCLLPSPA